MTFSEDLRVRVANCYSQGDVTMREVAEIFNVSLGFVRNMVTCYRRFGQATNSHTLDARGLEARFRAWNKSFQRLHAPPPLQRTGHVHRRKM
ncbi:hypothetical protein BDM02DRAFT_3124450 [Thelephora ganbajun]|uniref:Uncharacterized protein n=1 Tax=Thelephora ganbajun TaxID=370292 RepID=A0ACB6YYS5_THEGA|nr:hypothetical protein BDM02DRAFT_3124450 [Thelephora ganbajun]